MTRFFLDLFNMFYYIVAIRIADHKILQGIIRQKVENTSFLESRPWYWTRLRKVTKVTYPISDFAFLLAPKSGKSRIKNPLLNSTKGTHPKFHWHRFSWLWSVHLNSGLPNLWQHLWTRPIRKQEAEWASPERQCLTWSNFTNSPTKKWSQGIQSANRASLGHKWANS